MISFSCIVPFYNEALRPLEVIESIGKIRQIKKIIAIDDGSTTDYTFKAIKRKFPQITAVRLATNSGKANAIREGLKHVGTDYTLLTDSDLTNIKIEELEKAIQKMVHNPHMDMIILRRVADKSAVGWTRDDIIFSGQRIVKTEDLQKIFEKQISRYQVEIAINDYMIRKCKKVYWMPFSVQNPRKYHKLGWLEGLRRGYSMFDDIVHYAGWRSFLWQTLFFCRDEVP